MRIIRSLMFFSGCICCLSAYAGQYGPSLPGTMILPVSKLVRRVKFHFLLPHHPPAGYKLHKAMLAWCAPEEVNNKNLPARQAACLVYTGSGQSIVYIIETPSLPNVSPTENVDCIIGDGYFFKYVKVGHGARLLDRIGHTDYGIVYDAVPDKTVQQFQQSLQSAH